MNEGQNARQQPAIDAAEDSSGRKLVKLGVACLVCVGLAVAVSFMIQSLIS